MNLKSTIYNFIREDDENDLVRIIIDCTLILLIIVNVFLVILDTFNMPVSYYIISRYIENFSIAIFTIEYILRLWTSNLKYQDTSSSKARLKYVFSFIALIDLAAILPFYIPFIIPVDLRILRALRVIRLLRLFKINRYTNALGSIALVFKNKKFELLSSFFVVILLMIISSVIMYTLENTA